MGALPNSNKRLIGAPLAMVRSKTVPTKKSPAAAARSPPPPSSDDGGEDEIDVDAIAPAVANPDGGAVMVVGKKPRKKYRAKPGRAALREIRRLQKSTELVIPKLPFQRLVREIVQDCTTKGDLRFTRTGILTLQEATEDYVAELFRHSMLSAVTNNRRTIMEKDMRLVRKLRGNVTFL